MNLRPLHRQHQAQAMISSVAAAARIQDGPSDPQGGVTAYPEDLDHHTVTAMNRFGIEYHELEDWMRLKRSKQFTAGEAAKVIHNSRRGRP